MGLKNDFLVIITSSSMSNYSTSLISAFIDYGKKEKKYILWMHFVVSSNGSFLLFNSKSNISKTEAENNIDLFWQSYVENFKSSFNEYFLLFEDTANEEKFREEKLKIQERELPEPYDCSKQPCNIIIKQRAWCCYLTESEKNYSVLSNLNNLNQDYLFQLYQKGVTAGVLDGIIDSGIFVYDVGKNISESVIYAGKSTDAYLLYKVFRGENLDKAIEERNSNFKKWESISILPPIFNTEFYKQIFNSLTTNFGIGVSQLYLYEDKIVYQAYFNGKTVFNIILFELSGGSKAIQQSSKFLTEKSGYVANKLKEIVRNEKRVNEIAKESIGQYTRTPANKIKYLAVLSINRVGDFLDLKFGKGKWTSRPVSGYNWVDHIVESGLPNTNRWHEIEMWEELGEKMQEKWIHIENVPGEGSISGIDGISLNGKFGSLKNSSTSSIQNLKDNTFKDLVNSVRDINLKNGNLYNNVIGYVRNSKLTYSQMVDAYLEFLNKPENLVKLKTFDRIYFKGIDEMDYVIVPK